MSRRSTIGLVFVALVFAPGTIAAQNDSPPPRFRLKPPPDTAGQAGQAPTAQPTPAPGAAFDTSRTWYDSHAEALEAARRMKKQVLTIVEAEWCRWCKAMNDSTWSDPGVVAAAKGLVFARVDADLDTVFAAKYRVNRIPTALLTNDQGIEVDRFVGYFGPAEMREGISRALEAEGTLWGLERRLQDARNDPAIMMQIVYEYIERGEPAKAEEYLGRVRSIDPEGAQGYADDVLFVSALIEREERSWYKALEHLKQLVKKYPESEWREDAELYIPWLLAQTGDKKEALKKYNEFLDRFGSSSETQWVKRQIAKLEVAENPPSSPSKEGNLSHGAN